MKLEDLTKLPFLAETNFRVTKLADYGTTETVFAGEYLAFVSRILGDPFFASEPIEYIAAGLGDYIMVNIGETFTDYIK